MTARMHRLGVGLAPIVIGALTVLIQETSTRHLDVWVIAGAVASGALTTFLNYLRAGSDIPPVPLNPPKVAP